MRTVLDLVAADVAHIERRPSGTLRKHSDDEPITDVAFTEADWRYYLSLLSLEERESWGVA